MHFAPAIHDYNHFCHFNHFYRSLLPQMGSVWLQCDVAPGIATSMSTNSKGNRRRVVSAAEEAGQGQGQVPGGQSNPNALAAMTSSQDRVSPPPPPSNSNSDPAAIAAGIAAANKPPPPPCCRPGRSGWCRHCRGDVEVEAAPAPAPAPNLVVATRARPKAPVAADSSGGAGEEGQTIEVMTSTMGVAENDGVVIQKIVHQEWKSHSLYPAQKQWRDNCSQFYGCSTVVLICFTCPATTVGTVTLRALDRVRERALGSFARSPKSPPAPQQSFPRPKNNRNQTMNSAT